METSLFQFHHPLGRFPPLKPPFGATGGETTEVRGTGSVDRPGQSSPDRPTATGGWTATRIEQIETRITAGWLPPSLLPPRLLLALAQSTLAALADFSSPFPALPPPSLHPLDLDACRRQSERTNGSHLVPSLPFPMSVETTPILSNISKFSEGVEGRWKEEWEGEG